MQLSVQQTQELLRIIDKNQLTVVATELGTDYLTEYDRQLLRSYGIDPDTLYAPELSAITTSFHFGMLADALGAVEAAKITYADIKQYVKDGKYLPVSIRQQAALDSIKMQTFSSLKSLNGKIFADINNVLVDNSRQGQQEFLAQELKTGMEKMQTVTKIAHEIAHKTGDWNRNFDRIIETASQTALEHGKAADLQRRNEGRDPDVYKHVQDGACKHCIRLYCTAGIGSEPIIFKLSELINNGSNIGRKVAEWVATLDALHPHCRCSLMEKPEGYLWNPATRSFSTPDPEYKKQTEKQRPLIPVQIGEKLFHL